jgi:Protein of unknown function (DUF2809)
MDHGGRRRGILLALAVVIAAGLASRRWPQAQPVVVATYAGDVLWAMMVYGLVALAVPHAPSPLVAGRALVVAWTVELSQTLHLPWLDAVRQTRIGALLLGQGFLWSDLWCYAAGVALACLLDQVWRRRAPAPSSLPS